MARLVRPILPYLALSLLLLAIVVAIPKLSTWLPALMYT